MLECSPELIKKYSNTNISKIKVINPSTILLVGIPLEFADEAILSSLEFLGQYGDILQIDINKSLNYANEKNISFSAFVKYKTEFSAALAIIALDNLYIYTQEVL